MHRVDSDGHVANKFSAGDPANGQWPTELDADWHNAVQENICRAIEGAGIVLSKGDDLQLRDAILAHVSQYMTAAQILARLVTVDGSGSGLDADLLRGLTPEQVVNAARIVAGLGYAPAIGSGMIGNGDMNAVTNSGLYRFNQPTNGPPGEEWGQLLVMHGASDTIAQIVASISGNLWVRAGSPPVVGGIGSWSPWKGLVTASAPVAYTAADVLAKLLTVDGSGSGLDADLLRGLTPDQVVNATRIVAGLGYYPVQQGTGVGQLGNTVKLGWDGSFLRATVDSTDLGFLISNLTLAGALLEVNGSIMRRNGHHLFGPDNDGSGSGADADLWRGMAPETSSTSGSNANGKWRRQLDGTIIQTSVRTLAINTRTIFDFPIAFPNEVLGFSVACDWGSAGAGGYDPSGGRDLSLSQYALYNVDDYQPNTIRMTAWGY